MVKAHTVQDFGKEHLALLFDRAMAITNQDLHLDLRVVAHFSATAVTLQKPNLDLEKLNLDRDQSTGVSCWQSMNLSFASSCPARKHLGTPTDGCASSTTSEGAAAVV